MGILSGKVRPYTAVQVSSARKLTCYLCLLDIGTTTKAVGPIHLNLAAPAPARPTWRVVFRCLYDFVEAYRIFSKKNNPLACITLFEDWKASKAVRYFWQDLEQRSPCAYNDDYPRLRPGRDILPIELTRPRQEFLGGQAPRSANPVCWCPLLIRCTALARIDFLPPMANKASTPTVARPPNQVISIQGIMVAGLSGLAQ